MEPCNNCEECNKLCEIVPQMAGTFKALGDLTRLQIIYLLSMDTSGTLGVSELAARLKISQPAVSQHLKTLKSEGLVGSRREGFYIYYTVNRERMVEFRKHFELMHATVMANCNREMLRRTNRDRNIRACVIFYSFSGITRHPPALGDVPGDHKPRRPVTSPVGKGGESRTVGTRSARGGGALVVPRTPHAFCRRNTSSEHWNRRSRS